MSRPTNDLLDLTPRTELAGPELEFDLAGLEIGCAEYDEGPTGCTVFHFPAGAVPKDKAKSCQICDGSYKTCMRACFR